MTTPHIVLDQHAKAITEKLIELALAGDLTALRLCVDRILPRSKIESGINFNLPEGRIDSGENMLQIANNITQAVATGELTIDEAKKFTDFLKHQRWQISEAENKRRSEEWERERIR